MHTGTVFSISGWRCAIPLGTIQDTSPAVADSSCKTRNNVLQNIFKVTIRQYTMKVRNYNFEVRFHGEHVIQPSPLQSCRDTASIIQS